MITAGFIMRSVYRTPRRFVNPGEAGRIAGAEGDRDGFGGSDGELDLIAVDAENGDLDIVSDADSGFGAEAGAAGENQHELVPSFAGV
jgi:hypothetical protein